MKTFHHIRFASAHVFRLFPASLIGVMCLLGCESREEAGPPVPAGTSAPAADAVNSPDVAPGDGAAVGHLVLQDQDGRPRTLSEIADGRPLVLAWYQSAGTRGCEAECRAIDRIEPRLSDAGVAVALASMDPVEANASFAQAMGVDLTLWSDPQGTTATAMGVLHPSGRFPLRWTFYIDATGTVRHVDRSVDPVWAQAAIFEQLNRFGWANIPAASQ